MLPFRYSRIISKCDKMNAEGRKPNPTKLYSQSGRLNDKKFPRAHNQSICPAGVLKGLQVVLDNHRNAISPSTASDNFR